MGGAACASSGQHAIAIACMPVMPILASSNAQTLYIQEVIIISVHSYVCVSWSFSYLCAPRFALGGINPMPNGHELPTTCAIRALISQV